MNAFEKVMGEIDEVKTKTVSVSLSVNQEEKKYLYAMAAKQNLNVSDFLRKYILLGMEMEKGGQLSLNLN